uniref:Uncharacterized protein n=1 Tax=viral metagenome TaxID=1070528 RepID=A0A6M3LWX2_9ZZZZ
MRIPKRLNPEWKETMSERIQNAKEPKSEFFDPVLLTDPLPIKWLILNLADKGFKPSVENLGGGVKRIGISGIACPTCGHCMS